MDLSCSTPSGNTANDLNEEERWDNTVPPEDDEPKIDDIEKFKKKQNKRYRTYPIDKRLHQFSKSSSSSSSSASQLEKARHGGKEKRHTTPVHAASSSGGGGGFSGSKHGPGPREHQARDNIKMAAAARNPKGNEEQQRRGGYAARGGGYTSPGHTSPGYTSPGYTSPGYTSGNTSGNCTPWEILSQDGDWSQVEDYEKQNEGTEMKEPSTLSQLDGAQPRKKKSLWGSRGDKSRR